VILGHKLREKQVTLNKDLAADLPVLETACRGLNQVWTNLLDNAIDAVPQQGSIRLRTWLEESEAGTGGDAPRQICILVGDNGPGIPLEYQAKIFDPFFTTKPVGVGTGLGLGIVYRIVEQYGGTIYFSSAPGCTEFFVRLPLSATHRNIVAGEGIAGRP
jgi:signal transduction histidine kinase